MEKGIRTFRARSNEKRGQREQEFAETAKREERKIIFWISAITALIVIGFVLRDTTTFEPHWSDSDTNATNAPWLDGFSASERETILQEAYLFDAATKELEADRVQ